MRGTLSSSRDDDWSSVLGKFGLSERNPAGERLLMWCRYVIHEKAENRQLVPDIQQGRQVSQRVAL